MPINEVKNKPSLQPYLSHQLTAERLLSKNALTFQTSRSTSSLPSLVSYNNSSNHLKPTQVNAMRRGYSQEPTRSFKKPTEQLKKTPTTKRRHSFSNFLAIKFAKKPITDDSKQTAALTATNIITFSNSTLAGNKPLSTTQQAKKGHRPRSYSELPYNLPQVERAPPVAITNKTPAYEYYGFVMYLSSFVVFGIYILWAYLPDGVLDQLGITYYPSRYWALAIPIWLMTFVWFIFLSFMAINLMNTPSFNSIYCITDEHANVMCMDKEMISDRPPDWMPELYDIPIGLVNTILYQEESRMPSIRSRVIRAYDEEPSLIEKKKSWPSHNGKVLHRVNRHGK